MASGYALRGWWIPQAGLFLLGTQGHHVEAPPFQGTLLETAAGVVGGVVVVSELWGRISLNFYSDHVSEYKWRPTLQCQRRMVSVLSW